MKPLPTDAVGRKQLWSHIQVTVPEVADLMNTLKAQGITSKVVRYECADMSFGNPEESKFSEWQIDEALISRVEAERRATERASNQKLKGKRK